MGIFSENIRDGFRFDPIEVAPCPDKPGWYRLLDGAHRWSAYKSTGVEEVNAIGRSRQTVDSYLTDLRASNRMGLDIKIFRLNRLGIPQDRIAKSLGLDQKTIHSHLGEMPALAFLLNGDLLRGFSVSKVAEKHGWTDPMVWSLALEGKNDTAKFKELVWGLRTWNQWEWNDTVCFCVVTL